MSCIVDYDAKNLQNDPELKRMVQGKFQNRAQSQTGTLTKPGKNNTELGPCFLCLGAATIKVMEGRYYYIVTALFSYKRLKCQPHTRGLQDSTISTSKYKLPALKLIFFYTFNLFPNLYGLRKYNLDLFKSFL